MRSMGLRVLSMMAIVPIKRGLILQVLLLADHAMARQFCHGEVVGFRFVFEPAFIAEAR